MARYPPIDLANEQPFAFGAFRVVPAACELVGDGHVQSLEPRVMQALVVLARAEGEVVSRAELVDRCWGGRIVGENAVNRVMSRIRNLAETMGAGSFRLETITKVGYRLRLAGGPDAENVAGDSLAVAPPPAGEQAARGDSDLGAQPPVLPVGRRQAIAGGAAALGIAAVAWAWTDGARGLDAPSRQARLLHAKGKEAQGQLLLSQANQSVAYLQEAVRLDPGYADAWGSLAISYANLAEFADDPAQDALAQRLISAANRARALDPGNADADVALILVTPHFRHWARVEWDCRQGLLRHPDHVRLRGKIPRILCDTGRWREGADGFEGLVSDEPYRPALQNQLALALWGAGRIEEAEQVIGRARNLWPEHPVVRATQFDFLALTGRSAAALPIAAAWDSSPKAALIGANPWVPIARALASRAPVQVEAAVAAIDAALRAGTIGSVAATPYLAAFGQIDRGFAVLADYYFGRQAKPGGKRTPPGRLARRETDFLFAPAMAPLRNDGRFAGLTAAVGLDAYWTATGSRPDWRR